MPEISHACIEKHLISDRAIFQNFRPKFQIKYTRFASLFHRHELEKKREYGDRIRNVDCESFTPLVFSTFGGLGKEATIFYNRLADLLSQKHNTSYNQTLSWMRCALSFSLLRSAVLAIRGSRKCQSTVLSAVSTELRLVESRVLID